MLSSLIVLLMIPLISALELVPADQIVKETRPMVITFISDECGKQCDIWVEWMRQLEAKHPRLAFAVVDAEYEEAFEILNVSLSDRETKMTFPESILVIGDNQYLRKSERTFAGLSRWIDDIEYKQTHPLFRSVKIHEIGKWVRRFDASVQIYARDEPPLYGLLGELPSVGFAWGVSELGAEPHAFVTSLDGAITFRQNATGEWLHTLMKELLPPVVPFHMFDDTPVTNEVVNHYALREVYIASKEPLEPWWDDFSRMYLRTVFVLFDNDEDAAHYNLTFPSVTTFNRSITFTYPGVDIGAVRWFGEVDLGVAEPSEPRPARLPPVRDDRVEELTSVTFHEKLLHRESFSLLLYDDKTPTKCTLGFSSSDAYDKARMHMDGNDHERLHELARAGFVFDYIDGRVTKVTRCN